MDSPYFTVVVPSYNRGYCIEKTIASILAQQFQSFEVLVVDDGSTDNTDEVIAGISDGRVHYYKKANGERGAARNFGTARAKGSYINFFDSDDLMYPNHLSEAKRFIDTGSDLRFFHLGYDMRTPEGTLQASINDFSAATEKQVLFDNRLSCNGVFLRTDIARQFLFEENRVLASSEDWELWIKLICRFGLQYSNTITSTVVNHDMRSLRTIQADKVVARDLLLIQNLEGDPEVMARYGKTFRKFVAERYSFFMLCMAEQQRRTAVWQWGMKAFQIYPLILMSKRFLAAIKNSIL